MSGYPPDILSIWESLPIIWGIRFPINPNYGSIIKTSMYCRYWYPTDNCGFLIIMEYIPFTMVYPCLLSNLSWTGDLLCVTGLLWGTSSSISLEAVSIGDVSLGAEAIDMNSLVGDPLVTGSPMGVGSVFCLCLRSCSPVSWGHSSSLTGILGFLWDS